MSSKKSLLWGLLAGVSICLSAPALARVQPAAQRAGAPRAVRSQPRPSLQPAQPAAQRLRFDDDLVEGATASGGGTLISGEKPAKQSQLLITRASFLPELLKSAEDL